MAWIGAVPYADAETAASAGAALVGMPSKSPGPQRSALAGDDSAQKTQLAWAKPAVHGGRS
jgi:hypothetical protein